MWEIFSKFWRHTLCECFSSIFRQIILVRDFQQSFGGMTFVRVFQQILQGFFSNSFKDDFCEYFLEFSMLFLRSIFLLSTEFLSAKFELLQNWLHSKIFLYVSINQLNRQKFCRKQKNGSEKKHWKLKKILTKIILERIAEKSLQNLLKNSHKNLSPKLSFEK